MAKKPRYKNRSNTVINSIKPSKRGPHKKRIFKKKREISKVAPSFIHQFYFFFFFLSCLLWAKGEIDTPCPSRLC